MSGQVAEVARDDIWETREVRKSAVIRVIQRGNIMGVAALSKGNFNDVPPLPPLTQEYDSGNSACRVIE